MSNPKKVQNTIPKTDISDISDIDTDIAKLILFLHDDPEPSKTDKQIVKGILGFDLATLGKAITMGLIEHCGHALWLTSEGNRIAERQKRLQLIERMSDADKMKKDHEQDICKGNIQG